MSVESSSKGKELEPVETVLDTVKLAYELGQLRAAANLRENDYKRIDGIIAKAIKLWNETALERNQARVAMNALLEIRGIVQCAS